MTFTIKRGTNISHFLSQSDARGEERRKRFTRDDATRIADWGFDHIRLPIDEVQMWQTDGTRETEAFDLLHQALDWCHDAGLRVIVDMHILRSHYFISAEEPALYNDPAELERFAMLWRDLSAALSDQPNDRVAYELLNEAVADDHEKWNRVSAYVFKALRELEPERTLVLGSNRWDSVDTFPHLTVPDDDNLILTFHYYRPMLVTHYRAGWTDFHPYTGPIQYPGYTVTDEHVEALKAALPGNEEAYTYHDRDVMVKEIKLALEVAQRTNNPLYCGEFGVIDVAPLDIRQRWYRDMISVFDELGIAWANWDFRGNFGIITRDGDDTGIRAALLG